jgi:hypothetical protein
MLTMTTLCRNTKARLASAMTVMVITTVVVTVRVVTVRVVTRTMSIRKHMKILPAASGKVDMVRRATSAYSDM